MPRPIHHDGDPDGCAEDCTGPHFEDAAPQCCEQCGGNGRACMYGCVESRRVPYEPFEGRTAADEVRDEQEEWA